MTDDLQLDTVSLEELQSLHRDHERRLEELNGKAWLTPSEEVEEKRLKKVKLRIKDQMQQLRRSAAN